MSDLEDVRRVKFLTHDYCVNDPEGPFNLSPVGVIERLTAEVAEKDKMIEGYQYNLGEKIERIEELLEAEIEPIVGVFRNGHLVTYKQIDAAWTFVIDPPGYLSQDAKDAVRAALSAIHVVACDECGGSGALQQFMVEPSVNQGECPSCHGHRWIITSQLVDKCGQFGTGDDDEK